MWLCHHVQPSHRQWPQLLDVLSSQLRLQTCVEAEVPAIAVNDRRIGDLEHRLEANTFLASVD